MTNEEMRAKVWSDACCYVASAFNCKEPKSAISWADSILSAFDERFNIKAEEFEIKQPYKLKVKRNANTEQTRR